MRLLTTTALTLALTGSFSLTATAAPAAPAAPTDPTPSVTAQPTTEPTTPATQGSVYLSVNGKGETYTFTKGKTTVADLLKEAKATVGPKDKLSAALTSTLEDKQLLTVISPEVATFTKTVPVPFSRATGKAVPCTTTGTKVTTKGVNGVLTETWAKTSYQGLQASLSKVKAVVTKPAVTEVTSPCVVPPRKPVVKPAPKPAPAKPAVKPAPKPAVPKPVVKPAAPAPVIPVAPVEAVPAPPVAAAPSGAIPLDSSYWSNQYFSGQADTQVNVAPPAATSGTPTVPVGGTKTDWMQAAGIAQSDWGFVDYIVQHESGWRVTVKNSSSSAYGLCQALPGRKMASAGADWATNPVTQLRWCDGYAKSRYGGWENSYNEWRRKNWW